MYGALITQWSSLLFSVRAQCLEYIDTYTGRTICEILTLSTDAFKRYLNTSSLLITNLDSQRIRNFLCPCAVRIDCALYCIVSYCIVFYFVENP